MNIIKKHVFFASFILILTLLSSGCGGGGGGTSSSSGGTSTTSDSLSVTNQSPYDGAYVGQSTSSTSSMSTQSLSTQSLPSTLRCDFHISKIRISTDGSTWTTILEGDTAFDVLNSSALSGTGLQTSISTTISSGTYQAMEITLSDIRFVDSSASYDKSVLDKFYDLRGTSSNTITFSNGLGVSSDDQFMLPIKIDSRANNIILDIYLARDTITTDSQGNYVMTRIPQFRGYTDSVDNSNFATISGTISRVNLPGGNSVSISSGNNVYVGVFLADPTLEDSRNGINTQPIYGTRAVVSSGVATYTLSLPAGNYKLLGFEDTGNNMADQHGPNLQSDPAGMYGNGGVNLRGEQISVSAGESQSKIFNIFSQDS